MERYEYGVLYRMIVALRQRIATGGAAPAAHASTHYDGGTDQVDVTQLDGFPGGTTNFLRADGTFAAAGAGAFTFGVTIDGAGVPLTTGVKGYVQLPRGGTITAARLFADQSGSIVVDVWKDSYANFPPVDADSITASAPPTLSGAQKSEDTTLTGWTTSVSAGDIIGFNVDSASAVTRVTLQLTVTP